MCYAQSHLTLYNPMDHSPPVSSVHGIFPDKNPGAGCHFLLQGIFLIQGPKLHLLCLLHWQADLGSPGKASQRDTVEEDNVQSKAEDLVYQINNSYCIIVTLQVRYKDQVMRLLGVWFMQLSIITLYPVFFYHSSY